MDSLLPVILVIQKWLIWTKYVINGYTDCPRVVVRTNGNDIGVDNRKNEDDFFRRVLLLIFLRCHVNCDGHRLKYIIVLVLFYFKLSWIYTIQIMIESRIAQWQNIIYIAEGGIKVWWLLIAYSHRKWTIHSFRPSDNYTMYSFLNTDIYKLHT